MVSSARSRLFPSDRRRGLALATLFAAAGAISGSLARGHGGAAAWCWLHWLCKPLATGLILLLVWRTDTPVSPRYRRWIAAGVVCSLIGDVLLMLPHDLFVPGLLAFLLGHLCFLGAFLGDSRFASHPLLLFPSLGFGALNLWLLWDSIDATLRVPVIVYVVVLASMAGQALVRARVFVLRADPQAHAATLAAAGALVFMLSDCLLAWNRFHVAIPLSSLWVLSTYYLAMWWIARSVQRRVTMDETGASK